MNIVKIFAEKFAKDWSTNLAAMLAYGLITAIFPVLLAILSLAGIVLNNLSPRSLTELAARISAQLPANLRSVVDARLLLDSLIHITGPLAVISLVALLWAGSNLFGAMENAFSIVFRTDNRNFVAQKLMSVGMVVFLAVLLPLSLAASSLVTAGSSAFGAVLPRPFGVVLGVVGPLTSLGILWVLFVVIYIVVPNITVPFRAAWRGALTAALLSSVFNLLFPLYFKLFLTGNAKYGAAAATALVLVVWLWFFALITMIGAQVNAVAMGIKPTRYDLARTLCDDYKEHTISPAPADQSHPGLPGQGNQRQSRHFHGPVDCPARREVSAFGKTPITVCQGCWPENPVTVRRLTTALIWPMLRTSPFDAGNGKLSIAGPHPDRDMLGKDMQGNRRCPALLISNS